MHFNPSDDGKVIDGKVVVYLYPRRAAEAAPDEAGGKGEDEPAHAGATAKEHDGADAGPKKEAAADQAKVKNLRWSADSAKHGEEVEMLADAPDGATLLLTLERRAGTGQWQALGSVKAKVEGGTAKASMKLEHPGSLDPVHCRFRARLL